MIAMRQDPAESLPSLLVFYSSMGSYAARSRGLPTITTVRLLFDREAVPEIPTGNEKLLSLCFVAPCMVTVETNITIMNLFFACVTCLHSDR
jgi:hypothetical protein